MATENRPGVTPQLHRRARRPSYYHVAALVAGLLTVAPACADTARPGAIPGGEATSSMATRAVQQVAADSARLLDVRTDAEWSEGHAVDAVHLELARIEAGELPAFDRRDRIFVYCRTGSRAAKAIAVLKEAGYSDLVNIGGLEDWQRAGGPVTKDA